MKRIVSILLAVCMLFSLTACDIQKPDKKESGNTKIIYVEVPKSNLDSTDNTDVEIGTNQVAEPEAIETEVPSNEPSFIPPANQEITEEPEAPKIEEPEVEKPEIEEATPDLPKEEENKDTPQAEKNENAFDTEAFLNTMPENLKGTTITFLNWYHTDDRIAEKENIEAFEKKTGINVEIIAPEFKLYTEKLAALVATGNSPDVIRMSKPKAAWMKTLQPIVNTGYDFSDKAWNSQVKETYSVNGIQYAANLSYTPFIVFSTVQYHTDTMKEWGFEDPWELWQKGEWTWDKMNEMSTEWIEQGPDYYGFATVNFEAAASTKGLDFLKYNGSSWELDLYNFDLLDVWRGIIEERENRYSVQGTYTTFDNVKHKALFAYCDSTSLEASTVYSQKLKKRGVWGVVPTPKHKDSEYYVPLTELLAFGVPTGAKNPEAVPYFIAHYANLAEYNPDTFFHNEQAKAVFEDMVSRPNRFLSMSSSVFEFDNNPFIWHLYNNAASTQITTFIETQEYRCQDKLNQLNEVLYNMDKTIK